MAEIDITELRRQLLDYATSLFAEEYLNSQFEYLQQLRTPSNQDFVVNTASHFFKDAERVLNQLTTIFNNQIVDWNIVETSMFVVKGGSSSIGAQRILRASVTFLEHCEEKDAEGCINSLEQVKNEYYLVKCKLETLFKLEQQLVAAGGLI